MLKIGSLQAHELFNSKVDLTLKILLDFSSKDEILKKSPNRLLMSIVW